MGYEASTLLILHTNSFVYHQNYAKGIRELKAFARSDLKIKQHLFTRLPYLYLCAQGIFKTLTLKCFKNIMYYYAKHFSLNGKKNKTVGFDRACIFYFAQCSRIS